MLKGYFPQSHQKAFSAQKATISTADKSILRFAASISEQSFIAPDDYSAPCQPVPWAWSVRLAPPFCFAFPVNCNGGVRQVRQKGIRYTQIGTENSYLQPLRLPSGLPDTLRSSSFSMENWGGKTTQVNYLETVGSKVLTNSAGKQKTKTLFT